VSVLYSTFTPEKTMLWNCAV